MRHSANLDILRTFAVTSVLIQHLVKTLVAHAGFANSAIIVYTRSVGRAGVIAFFVHTSLVLMYSLERMTRTSDRITLRFYLRRFFRIYPLSIFCITLALILHIPSTTEGTVDIVTPRVIIANLLLVQNLFTKTSVLSPLWSLPYEVEMYIVLPALYYLALRKRGVAYLCGLLACFCCLGFLVSQHTGGHVNMFAYIPCFLCGILCYSLRDRIPAFIPSVFWPPYLLLLFVSFCLAKPDMLVNMFWIGWIFCLFLGAGINAFHNSTNKPLNIAAEKIALYSYGMYLLHIPALYLVFMVFGIKNRIFGPFLFVVLTIAASAITYYFIEFPFIAIGRRLSSRTPRAPVILPSP